MKWDRIDKIMFRTICIMATGVGILYLTLAILLVLTYAAGKIGGWA